MSAASTYLQNALLNHLLRGAELPAPASVYVALHVEDPTEEALEATEVAGAGYARMQLTEGFSEGVAGITLNSEALEFPEAEEDWGTIKYVAIWDAATEGNMLMAGPLGTYRAIATGDVARWEAGALEIRIR